MATSRDQVRKTIAGSLRMERRERGYTQRSLGEAMGTAESTVNGWEGGNGAVSLEDAWIIADLYGTTLDQLAGRTPST